MYGRSTAAPQLGGVARLRTARVALDVASINAVSRSKAVNSCTIRSPTPIRIAAKWIRAYRRPIRTPKRLAPVAHREAGSGPGRDPPHHCKPRPGRPHRNGPANQASPTRPFFRANRPTRRNHRPTRTQAPPGRTSPHLLLQVAPATRSARAPNLFPNHPSQSLLQWFFRTRHMPAKCFIDQALVVPATRTIDLSAEPVDDIAVEPNRNLVFRFRHSDNRSPFGSAEVVFAFHGFSRYCLRSLRVANRAEINRTLLARQV